MAGVHYMASNTSYRLEGSNFDRLSDYLKDELVRARGMVDYLTKAIDVMETPVRLCGVCSGQMVDLDAISKFVNLVDPCGNPIPVSYQVECRTCGATLCPPVETLPLPTGGRVFKALKGTYPHIDRVVRADGFWFICVGDDWYRYGNIVYHGGTDKRLVLSEQELMKVLQIGPEISAERIIPSRAGIVYLISADTYVKIGFSARPHVRLQALQTACPMRLAMIAQRDGTMADESALHVRLAPYRTSGEWFALPPDPHARLLDWFATGIWSAP